MAAVGHVRFLKCWKFYRPVGRRGDQYAKILLNFLALYQTLPRYLDFSIVKVAAVLQLGLLKIRILTADRTERIEVCNRAKFCGDRSDRIVMVIKLRPHWDNLHQTEPRKRAQRSVDFFRYRIRMTENTQ